MSIRSTSPKRWNAPAVTSPAPSPAPGLATAAEMTEGYAKLVAR